MLISIPRWVVSQKKQPMQKSEESVLQCARGSANLQHTLKSALSAEVPCSSLAEATEGVPASMAAASTTTETTLDVKVMMNNAGESLETCTHGEITCCSNHCKQHCATELNKALPCSALNWSPSACQRNAQEQRYTVTYIVNSCLQHVKLRDAGWRSVECPPREPATQIPSAAVRLMSRCANSRVRLKRFWPPRNRNTMEWNTAVPS